MKHRRHRRVEAKGVAAHVDGGTDLQIENISAGGFFMRTTRPLPIGMPVRVELQKPGLKTTVEVSGRVVSVVTEREAQRQEIAPGVGIELDPLPLETEKRLHALLRELGLKDIAEPTELDPHSLYGVASPDTQQVASNVRGLLEMLSDALQKVKDREQEISSLKTEVRRLTAELRAARK